MQFLLKIILTALIVAGVSEIGKRSSVMAAVLASLPLTSILAFIWLYVETKDPRAVGTLSMDIFWLVIPSLAFFPLLAWLLKSATFWPSLLGASLVTAVLYVVTIRYI